ncbi:hypothetical protein [Streptomyces sp. SLBN-118]|uniref:hypothetical protein n=1 Tax=Streptomyces sp. SLBN-118 TaxID=2768454 RepID=UPI001C92D166|nr:hypothetical protein [Streptomyces sp. SLBN-118]
MLLAEYRAEFGAAVRSITGAWGAGRPELIEGVLAETGPTLDITKIAETATMSPT